MDNLNKLIGFLERLEEANIYYRLNKVRNGIMAEIAVPGERWEVEFLENGEIDVEKFISTGEVLDKKELDCLFEKFSD